MRSYIRKIGFYTTNVTIKENHFQQEINWGLSVCTKETDRHTSFDLLCMASGGSDEVNSPTLRLNGRLLYTGVCTGNE